MCSLGACHTPSGGGSRCYSTCLPDHPPPGLAVQTHTALVCFSSADFHTSSHFSSRLFLFCSSFSVFWDQKNPTKHRWICCISRYTCPLKRQKPLANGCPRRPKASTFGHLMAWMGPPVSCSWPVPLYNVGPREPLPDTPLSTLPPPACALHPPPSPNSGQQWLSPLCVMWGRTQTQPLFPFQKAQPSTWVIFLGICSVKYLAGAGLQGQLDGKKKTIMAKAGLTRPL